MRRTFLFLVLSFCGTAALADGKPGWSLTDDIPLAIYLQTLAHISPAAREAANGYLHAYRRRCGRALGTVELRKAIADGAGDPVLMAMMLAAFQRDTLKLTRLANAVSCVRGV